MMVKVSPPGPRLSVVAELLTASQTVNSLKYLTSSSVRNLPIVKLESRVVRTLVVDSGIVGPAPPRTTQRFGRPCQNWIWGPSDVSPLPASSRARRSPNRENRHDRGVLGLVEQDLRRECSCLRKSP